MTWENRLTFEVLGDVRNANPYFETDTSGWAGSNATISRSTDRAHEGVASLLIVPNGVSASGGATAGRMAVMGLVQYVASLWVYSPGGWADLRPAVDWYTAVSGGSFISSSLGTAFVVPAGVWTLLTATYTAPAAAAGGAMRARHGGTPAATDVYYADEVILTNLDESGQVWVDLTTRIRDAIQPVTTQSGRQNDLDQSEPGRLDALLDNSDDALTYGNTASPYPWWSPGRKCRLRERFGSTTLDMFTGYLQTPTEALITAPVDPQEQREQRVAITATDRLGWLASGEPFISTLAAHIIYNGGSNLVHYWALNDPSTSWRSFFGSPTIAPTAGATAFTGAAVVGPAGDDVSALRVKPGLLLSTKAEASLATITVSSGESLAVSAWLRQEPYDPAVLGTGGYAMSLTLGPNGPDFMYVFTDPIAAQFYASAGGATPPFGVATSPTPLPTDVWRLVTVRVSLPSGLVELWCGSDIAVTGNIGTPPATLQFNSMLIGQTYWGGIGHLQVHKGVNAFTRDMHLAQFRAGLSGLERQPTGDRIRTIAQYAGVPAAELTQIDKGTSVMQVARLAGKVPLTAMRDAERTEQGLLYVDGSGNLVFKDRVRLYNI